ncbi:MAG TPA: hypothetical protein DCM86_03685 [Verrucomicrobiales bacterium]|nr:hypothetical protein [Verrucomicrobiales bacterium]
MSPVDPTPDPALSTPPPTAEAQPPHRTAAGVWIRRLLVCNPFFLGSAALLLYGVGRISADANLFAGETENLLFNFIALQVYSGLLLGTALLLARRRVWYDSALLVVLDHGLVLVPFILVTQAAFLGAHLGPALVILAGTAAVLRAAAVRRGYPRFNLARRGLALGLGILLANMAAPLVVKQLVTRGSVEDWEGPNRLLWNLGLPALVAGALVLPKPLRYGGLNPERQWLPLFLHALWVGGTGVHVAAIAYVCKQPFHAGDLAPVLCAAAWMLFHRISDCIPEPAGLWRRCLLPLPLLLPFLAADDSPRLLALLAMNHLGYTLVVVRGRPDCARVARELSMASLALLLAALPADLLRQMAPGLDRAAWVGGVASGFLLQTFWRIPLPGAALAGAIVVLIGLTVLGPLPHPGLVGPQAALGWILIHSLRWSGHPEPADTSRLRAGAALLWSAQAALGTSGVPWQTGALVSTIGAAVFIAWWIAARGHAEPWLPLIPCAALAVFAAPPTRWALDHGPAGLNALAGSLLLFTLGARVAWSRISPSPTTGDPSARGSRSR